jgi:tetratricopeptide (TPR) repeat protein
MTRFSSIVVTAILAMPVIAQSPSLLVRVEKKANAQAQIDYARSLFWKVEAAGNPSERHTAVANAAANLIAVERAWPNNRAALIEANALLAQLYVDGAMPQNAIDTTERALALAPKDHRLHMAAGRSYARLGKKREAAAAYQSGIETFRPELEEMMASLTALNAAAFFLEKEKLHAHSAAALRLAASLRGITPLVRVTLRVRALEQSAITGDRQKAKEDLAHLREAHRVALGTSLTREQRALLNVAENAIKRFEKSL